jgi:hypothetical protein
MIKITSWLLLVMIIEQTCVYAGPIHDAALAGQLPKVLELIKSDKDVVNAIDDGFSALMQAARKGHLEVAKALLSAGANINAQKNRRHYTALMHAVINERADMVKFLLKNGARIDLVTSHGETVISKAYPEWKYGKVNNEILTALRQSSIETQVKITNPEEITILDGHHLGSYERDFAAYGAQRTLF